MIKTHPIKEENTTHLLITIETRTKKDESAN